MSRTTRAFVLRRAVSQEAFGQRCRAAAAHLPLGSEKAFVCVGTATHARAQTKNANAFQSAAALQALPRENVGQFVGAGAVAPARSARLRSQWCRLHRPSRVVVASTIHELRQARPNPSIERTSNGGAHCHAPSKSVAPSAAAHVKR